MSGPSWTPFVAGALAGAAAVAILGVSSSYAYSIFSEARQTLKQLKEREAEYEQAAVVGEVSSARLSRRRDRELSRARELSRESRGAASTAAAGAPTATGGQAATAGPATAAAAPATIGGSPGSLRTSGGSRERSLSEARRAGVPPPATSGVPAPDATTTTGGSSAGLPVAGDPPTGWPLWHAMGGAGAVPPGSLDATVGPPPPPHLSLSANGINGFSGGKSPGASPARRTLEPPPPPLLSGHLSLVLDAGPGIPSLGSLPSLASLSSAGASAVGGPTSGVCETPGVTRDEALSVNRYQRDRSLPSQRARAEAEGGASGPGTGGAPMSPSLAPGFPTTGGLLPDVTSDEDAHLGGGDTDGGDGGEGGDEGDGEGDDIGLGDGGADDAPGASGGGMHAFAGTMSEDGSPRGGRADGGDARAARSPYGSHEMASFFAPSSPSGRSGAGPAAGGGLPRMGSCEPRLSYEAPLPPSPGRGGGVAPYAVGQAAQAPPPAAANAVGVTTASVGGSASFGSAAAPVSAASVGLGYTPERPAETYEDGEQVCALLAEALEMRRKWRFTAAEPHRFVLPTWQPHLSEDQKAEATRQYFDGATLAEGPAGRTPHRFAMREGVVRVWAEGMPDDAPDLFPPPGTANEFFGDMHAILRMAVMGPVKTLCHHRLLMLEQKFNLHLMLNADQEFLLQKEVPHRDFYNVRKVDTHVHHSACMNQKHLLRFIKSKLRKEPDEVVIFRDGKYLTLKEVFESLGLTGYDLNVDTLDMHADKTTFHRFDKFNLKYNPCGQSRLREIFIKNDNLIQGRFLAELTAEVLSDLDATKYQLAEYRLSIYGRKAAEWDALAAWVINNRLHSENVVWMIQLPRLYNVYKEQGIIKTFQGMLDNVFLPLFEVTADPSTHPQLHLFLKQVVGFDMVDDESKPERRPSRHMRSPATWDVEHNPAYSYYMYYCAANLYVLNKFRESKGYNPLHLRPHAGEAGDVDHLVSAFLCARNIAHGNNLRKSPTLQYLFYAAQIGLSMSPLSNNSLFLNYHKNPFPMFFSRGINISLSTDDPLQIHLTKEPLVEEYSVAAQVWKLSSCDLCEIARNSVVQSGFPAAAKAHWVGHTPNGAAPHWDADNTPAFHANELAKSNVPDLRIAFRRDTLLAELRFIEMGASSYARKPRGRYNG